MKFNLTRPCSDCPFRSDIKFYLSPERKEEIARNLVEDENTFACHKTTDHEGWDDGEYMATGQESHCAGALIIMENNNLIVDNWRLRMTVGLGLLDTDKLDLSSPVCGSFEEWIQ